MDEGLTKEKETLLIPLFGRAKMSEEGLFEDKAAEQAAKALGKAGERLKIKKKLLAFMALRAAIFDDYTLMYLTQNPSATVLYLGCGLDSRCERLKNPAKLWYDLDFPEVIALKKRFFRETERYQFIGSSVTELSWLDRVDKTTGPVLIIAEGLLMYLSGEEIGRLTAALKEAFPNARLIFDAYSEFSAKYAKYQPSLRKTGAVIRWGVDTAEGLREIGLAALETKYPQNHPLVKKLSPYFRFMFHAMGRFRAVREAHRVFIAQFI
jgi:O-methyltransferase involved in polyketide biosynthesis